VKRWRKPQISRFKKDYSTFTRSIAHSFFRQLIFDFVFASSGMPRKPTSALTRSRTSSETEKVQHRHFRLTPHPRRHVDTVTMAVLVIGVFIELVIMTSVPLGTSLFEFYRRDAEGKQAVFAVRSQSTYQRWYRDEIQSFVPRSFFSVGSATAEAVAETERIHQRLLEMKVSRALQEVHLGLVVLSSRKQAYLSTLISGAADQRVAETLQQDLTAFRKMYHWLGYSI